MQFPTPGPEINLNELIKSPRQIKTLVKRANVSNSVVATPFHYSRSNVEELVISNTSFADEFSLTSLQGNKLLVVENCIFHKVAQLNCIRNIKIIIRNCLFRGALKIVDLESGMLELYGTRHNEDAILCNIKVDTFYTSQVEMKKENMLRLLNADVKNYMNM